MTIASMTGYFLHLPYIWILKDLNAYDKNVYIASYMNDVFYSKDYIYVNKWKLNFKWIWVQQANPFGPY